MTDTPRPLAGKRILVTRPRERAGPWREAFEAAGAEVLLCAVFVLESALPQDIPGFRELFRSLRKLRPSLDIVKLRIRAGSHRPWMAFTSASAVQFLGEILGNRREDLYGWRIACVGPATRAAIEEMGLTVEVEATTASGEELGRAILACDPEPFVAHPTSDRGLLDLERTITAAGGHVERVHLYSHKREAENIPILEAALERSELDLATFASPSAASGLIEQLSAAYVPRLLARPALALGKRTGAKLEELGFERRFVCPSPRIEDVVATACRAVGA